jgi:hypothetical protein
MMGKPEEGESGFNMAYTAGVGVRLESFYIDLGYRRTQRKSAITPYSDGPAAATNVALNDVLLTVGFKF